MDSFTNYLGMIVCDKKGQLLEHSHQLPNTVKNVLDQHNNILDIWPNIDLKQSNNLFVPGFCKEHSQFHLQIEPQSNSIQFAIFNTSSLNKNGLLLQSLSQRIFTATTAEAIAEIAFSELECYCKIKQFLFYQRHEQDFNLICAKGIEQPQVAFWQSQPFDLSPEKEPTTLISQQQKTVVNITPIDNFVKVSICAQQTHFATFLINIDEPVYDHMIYDFQAVGFLLGLAFNGLEQRQRFDLEIDRRQKSEKALLNSQKRYKNFFFDSQEGIAHFDIIPAVETTLSKAEQIELILQRIQLESCNNAMAKMYGFDNIAAYQASEKNLCNNKPILIKPIQQLVHSGYRLSCIQLEQEDVSSQQLTTENTFLAVIEDEKIVAVWTTQRNTTLNNQENEKLTYQINYDNLTGLPNRNKLINMVDDAARCSRQEGSSFALLMLNLDRFKDINDTMGHSFGDKVLQTVGPRLKNISHHSAINVARVGGDEFAILIEHINDITDAQTIAYRALAALRTQIIQDNIPVELDAHIGIALYPDHAKTRDGILRCADISMHKAKDASFKVTLYHDSLYQSSKTRIDIVNGLKSAIGNDEFDLVFQPQITSKTGKLHGFEALIRWQPSYQKSAMSPAKFIPLAEMSHQIHDITRWVIQACLHEVKNWQQQNIFVPVAINLSSRNLIDSRLMSYLPQLCQRLNIDPKWIRLELTESALLEDLPRSTNILKQLKRAGFSLCIDDFGTGYASLSYLRKLPVDILKIDRSFVQHVNSHQQDRTIVRWLIDLAHDLDLEVVAEGVEDQDIALTLTEMGCDVLQGFHYSKGISSEEVIKYIRNFEKKPALLA